MTIRSSEFGGSPYELGDLRGLPSYGRPGFFIEDGQEWLRTGMLRSNAGNGYADLLTRAPGYGVNFNVASDRLTNWVAPSQGGAPSHYRMELHRTVAGYYVLCPPPNDLGGIATLRVGTDYLVNPGSVVGVASVALTGYCYHNGIMLFCTRDGTANTGLKNFDSVIGSGTGYTAQEYAGIASNGSNLAVAIARGAPSNAANAFQTSVNGGVWTPRTGSSNLLSSMVGIHYAQWLGKFFKWGPAAGGGAAILSTSDGYTDSVAMPAQPGWTVVFGGLYGGMQHSAASTANATLIPVRRDSDSMYGWLRTTNGTAWTFVSPFLDPNLRGINAFAANVLPDLQYDAARSRLVAIPGSANSGDFPAFYFSSDNGSTWQASNAMDDADTAVGRFLGFSQVYGVDMAHVGTGAANGYLYSYPASRFDAVPSYVGTVGSYGPTAGVTYHIRIK